jgi:hypothetical protein
MCIIHRSVHISSHCTQRESVFCRFFVFFYRFSGVRILETLVHAEKMYSFFERIRLIGQ